MRPRCFTLWSLLISFLFTVGCSSGASNNKGKIEGTKWDNETATIEGKEIAAGSVYLEFSKDGKLIFGENEGTYTLGSGDQVTFNFDKEVSGRKSHVETVKVSGEKLTLSDSKGTIVFLQIRDDKFEGSVWYNEEGGGKGKYGDLVGGAIQLSFRADGSVEDGGRQVKIGTFVQGPGETLTINFTEKFRDTEWKSKNMPVTDNRYFSLPDVDGNVIKFKRSG